MTALQYVDIPVYSAPLLRRSLAALSQPGAIMSCSHEWLRGTGARWCSDTKTRWFPSGATLAFGYLESAGNENRYRGAELKFVGYDELTQFRHHRHTYLFSRLRRLTAGIQIPLRMRAASNPGIGHEWVKERFPVETPEMRATWTDDQRQPRDKDTGERVFIPARIRDNRHLDRETYVQA